VNEHTQLPNALRFPGGYVVPIVIEDAGVECQKCHAIHIEQESEEYHTDHGDYSSAEKTIRLWSGLTPRQRWRTLAHEYLHAWVDWQLWLEHQIMTP
jgi:hypothetical protein